MGAFKKLAYDLLHDLVSFQYENDYFDMMSNYESEIDMDSCDNDFDIVNAITDYVFLTESIESIIHAARDTVQFYIDDDDIETAAELSGILTKYGIQVK